MEKLKQRGVGLAKVTLITVTQSGIGSPVFSLSATGLSSGPRQLPLSAGRARRGLRLYCLDEFGKIRKIGKAWKALWLCVGGGSVFCYKEQ